MNAESTMEQQLSLRVAINFNIQVPETNDLHEFIERKLHEEALRTKLGGADWLDRFLELCA